MQDTAAIAVVAPTARRSAADRLRGVWRNVYPFLVVAAIWEIIAWFGVFHPRLFPSLETVARTFYELTLSGILPTHVAQTVLRLFSGFAVAGVIGVAAGILMGRSRRAEDILLPIVSILAPIPGLAYAPLFLLWFGIGNFPAVLLVGLVACFPVIFNTWTGVKAVKEIWLRSAQSMGADDHRLFRYVILPGALPYILTGLRLGLAQAWRILVALEMLVGVSWGLGWLIFGARELLNTDAMLAGIAAIGIIGIVLEKFVFQKIEDYTVIRWGMVTA